MRQQGVFSPLSLARFSTSFSLSFSALVKKSLSSSTSGVQKERETRTEHGEARKKKNQRCRCVVARSALTRIKKRRCLFVALLCPSSLVALFANPSSRPKRVLDWSLMGVGARDERPLVVLREQCPRFLLLLRFRFRFFRLGRCSLSRKKPLIFFFLFLYN